MPSWMKHTLESRFRGEISITSDADAEITITSDADDTTLMAESEEELKSLFMKVKEVSEKVGLKLNIQTSREIDGENVETVSDFILLGSKITADGDCSHEIKSCLLLGRKVMTNLSQSVSSVAQSCPTLCNHMNYSTPGLPVHHQLPEFTQTHVQPAKSLQSCSTLCDPIDGSPPGSPVPGILQARTLEWVAISFSNA